MKYLVVYQYRKRRKKGIGRAFVDFEKDLPTESELKRFERVIEFDPKIKKAIVLSAQPLEEC